MIPSVLEIAYPRERVSVPEARAILRPFLESAYHNKMSAYDFYHSVVAKTSVTMTTQDFFGWANAAYAHLDKATGELNRDPLSPFRISELAQEQSSVPDRFWARVQYTTVLPSGEEQTGYITYGFGDKASVAEIENDAYDYLLGSASAPGGEVSSMEITELYKQW